MNGPADVRFQRCGLDGIRWHVRCDWAAALSSDGAPSWRSLQEQQGAVLVKRNPARQIWRLKWNGQLVYCKIYRNAGRLDWLRERCRELFRGIAARREFRRLCWAGAHRITAPQPLACGTTGNGTSLLITASVGAERTLLDYCLRKPKATSAHALTRQLARLLAQLHTSGADHRDLHLGNIQLAETPRGSQLVLMDFFHVRRRAMKHRPSVEALARWHLAAARWTTRSNQLRFLQAYAEARGWMHHLDALAAQIQQRAEKLARRDWRRRQRRICRSSPYASYIVLGDGWRGRVYLCSKPAPTLSPTSNLLVTLPQWRAALGKVDRFYEASDSGVVKSGRTAVTRRANLRLGFRQVSVYIKATHRRRWYDLWISWIQRSRANRGWRVGHALLMRGLPVPRPLATLRKWRRGLRRGDVLISEAIEPSERLSWFIKHTLCFQRGRTRWLNARAIGTSLADILARMQRTGMTYRDCKTPNWLLQCDGPGRCRLYLVDLDGVQFRRFYHRRDPLAALPRLTRSVMQMHPQISRTERLRVLRHYLSRLELDWTDWKASWKRIAAQIADE